MTQPLDLNALLDPLVRIRELEDALRDMQDAYLVEHNGCAPIAQQTPALRIRRRAYSKTLRLIGKREWPMVKGGEPPCFPELRDEIEREGRDLLKRGDTSTGDDE